MKRNAKESYQTITTHQGMYSTADRKRKSAKKPTMDEITSLLETYMTWYDEGKPNMVHNLESVSTDGTFIYSTKCESGNKTYWKAKYLFNEYGNFETDHTTERLIPAESYANINANSEEGLFPREFYEGKKPIEEQSSEEFWGDALPPTEINGAAAIQKRTYKDGEQEPLYPAGIDI